MKIVSAFELSEQLSNKEAEIIELEDTVFKGHLALCRPCCLRFKYSPDSENSSSCYGNLTIQAPGVILEGLRLTGMLQISDGLREVELTECLISGSVRIGFGCDLVCFTECVISSQSGSVGVSVSDGSSVTMDRCHIDGWVTGFAVSQHAIMGNGSDDSVPIWAKNSLKDCIFSRNTVDVLVDIYIHGGDIDATTITVPIDSLVTLSTSDDINIDVSFRGLFDKPLLFKSWPVPRSTFPLVVPRRGNNSSGRQCILRFDADNLIIYQDLPTSNAPTPRARKRKQPDGKIVSKAALYYCRILELDPGASRSDILSSYRRMALRYHPDKNDKEGDKFILIKRARDELIRMLDE